MKQFVAGMAIMALICSVALNIAQYRGVFTTLNGIPTVEMEN